MRTLSPTRILAASLVASFALLASSMPAHAAEGDGPASGGGLASVADDVAQAAFEDAGLPDDPAGDVRVVIVTERDGARQVAVETVRDVDGASDEVLDALATRTVVSVGVDVPVTALTVVDTIDQWQMNPAVSSFQAAWTTATGAGVKVAVVDSGVVRNHPDLPSTRVLLGAEFIGGSGTQTAANGNRDIFGHGTFVSGVIAAGRGNGGIAGVAPDATILPVRVLGDNGSGSSADVTAGIYYAVAQGAKVINLSLGSTSGFTPMRDAIDYAVDHGVVVVAAAGNSGPETVNYPAAYSNALAVAALGPGNALASYSSYSTAAPYVDVAAPGSSITSTNTSLASDFATNPYRSGNGTSYATPHVTGVVALILEALPTTTPAQVRAAIEGSATDLGASGVDASTGAGVVRAAEAIVAADSPGGGGDGSVAFVATTPQRITSVKPKKGATTQITVAGTASVPDEAVSVLARITLAKAKAGTVTLTPYGSDSGAVELTTGAAIVTQTVTLPLGIGGKVILAMQVPATVTIDALGYTTPTIDANAGQLVDVAAARILDTRTGAGVALADPGDTKSCSDFSKWDAAHAWYWTYKGLYGDVAHLDANDDGIVCETLWGKLKVKPATTRPADLFKTNGKFTVRSTVAVSVLDHDGVPASGVAAVKLTVAAVDPKGKGTVQVLPTDGATLGSFTTLDFAAKTGASTTLIVPVGVDGGVTLYTKAMTHLTVDVVGYVTAA